MDSRTRRRTYVHKMAKPLTRKKILVPHKGKKVHRQTSKMKKKKASTKLSHIQKAVREANRLGGWGPYLMKHNKGFRDRVKMLRGCPICEKCLLVHPVNERCYWWGEGTIAKLLRKQRRKEGLPL